MKKNGQAVSIFNAKFGSCIYAPNICMRKRLEKISAWPTLVSIPGQKVSNQVWSNFSSLDFSVHHLRKWWILPCEVGGGGTYKDYNDCNNYNDYRDSDLDLDLDWGGGGGGDEHKFRPFFSSKINNSTILAKGKLFHFGFWEERVPYVEVSETPLQKYIQLWYGVRKL